MIPAICPVHNGAWSYKCAACREAAGMVTTPRTDALLAELQRIGVGSKDYRIELESLARQLERELRQSGPNDDDKRDAARYRFWRKHTSLIVPRVSEQVIDEGLDKAMAESRLGATPSPIEKEK